MISKSQIKNITALAIKSRRDEQKLFVSQGTKCTLELAAGFDCKAVFATENWISQHGKKFPKAEIFPATEKELERISALKTAPPVVAIFKKPDFKLDFEKLKNSLSIALCDVQDPGNLGTIIRLANWFGIRQIVCSPQCADCFSHKTVQATMGALARVEIHYTDLVEFFKNVKNFNLPIFGTFLEGENIFSAELSKNGIIVMGNEGSGISPEVAQFVTKKLLIPSYPENAQNVESLNVAIATGIVCAEFRRRKF